MSVLINKAMHGNEDAMGELYKMNKAQVFHVCSILLCDDSAVDSVVTKVFKSAFEQTVQGAYSSEEGFYEGVIRKSVNLCKAQTNKKNAKAFNVPINKNFLANVYDPNKMDFGGDIHKIVLTNLPALHRFIYVLYTLCSYSKDEIGKMFHMNEATVESALDSISGNITKIISLASTKMKMQISMDEERFHDWLLSSVDSVNVPKSVNAIVMITINNICTPVREKGKKQRMKNMYIAIAILLSVALIIGIAVAVSNNGDNSGDTGSTNADNTSGTSDDGTDEITYTSDYTATHYADIVIEGYGTITVALDGNKAPETVENFVNLANEGFYDGLTFHRIVEGFVMQGGDPDADGTGGNTDEDGNEINITGEFTANGSDNNLSHIRGAISMARGDDYDSASSQFFIVHTSDYTDSLDGLYAVFGYVTDGLDIVDAICEATYTVDEYEVVAADEQPVITSITIRDADEDDTAGDDTSGDDTANDDTLDESGDDTGTDESTDTGDESTDNSEDGTETE